MQCTPISWGLSHQRLGMATILRGQIHGRLLPADKGDFPVGSRSREPSSSIHLYNMAVAIPLELRIQRLRSDKGGKYISNECKQLCVNSGIAVEYTATAMSPAERSVGADWTGRRCRPWPGAWSRTATSRATCGANCSSRQSTYPTGCPT